MENLQIKIEDKAIINLYQNLLGKGYDISFSQLHDLFRVYKSGHCSASSLNLIIKTLWMQNIEWEEGFDEVLDSSNSKREKPIPTPEPIPIPIPIPIPTPEPIPIPEPTPIQEPTSIQEQAEREPFPNKPQFIEINDTEGTGSKLPEPDSQGLSHFNYHSRHYYPVKERVLEQSWRYLRTQDFQFSDQIDAASTCTKVAREKHLIHPIYLREHVYQGGIRLLIDQSDSMIAFEHLVGFLAKTLRTGLNRESDLSIGYFSDNLVFGINENEPFGTYKKWEVWAQENLTRQKTTVIILSDLGFARTFYEPQQLESMAGVLMKYFMPNSIPSQDSDKNKHFPSRVKKVLILTPIPKQKWKTTLEKNETWHKLLRANHKLQITELNHEELKELYKFW